MGDPPRIGLWSNILINVSENTKQGTLYEMCCPRSLTTMTRITLTAVMWQSAVWMGCVRGLSGHLTYCTGAPPLVHYTVDQHHVQCARYRRHTLRLLYVRGQRGDSWGYHFNKASSPDAPSSTSSTQHDFHFRNIIDWRVPQSKSSNFRYGQGMRTIQESEALKGDQALYGLITTGKWQKES